MQMRCPSEHTRIHLSGMESFEPDKLQVRPELSFLVDVEKRDTALYVSAAGGTP